MVKLITGVSLTSTCFNVGPLFLNNLSVPFFTCSVLIHSVPVMICLQINFVGMIVVSMCILNYNLLLGSNNSSNERNPSPGK
jgi:hypothetical protein